MNVRNDLKANARLRANDGFLEIAAEFMDGKGLCTRRSVSERLITIGPRCMWAACLPLPRSDLPEGRAVWPKHLQAEDQTSCAPVHLPAAEIRRADNHGRYFIGP